MYFKCLNNLVALPSDEYFVNRIMLFILDLVVVDFKFLYVVQIILKMFF